MPAGAAWSPAAVPAEGGGGYKRGFRSRSAGRQWRGGSAVNSRRAAEHPQRWQDPHRTRTRRGKGRIRTPHRTVLGCPPVRTGGGSARHPGPRCAPRSRGPGGAGDRAPLGRVPLPSEIWSRASYRVPLQLKRTLFKEVGGTCLGCGALFLWLVLVFLFFQRLYLQTWAVLTPQDQELRDTARMQRMSPPAGQPMAVMKLPGLSAH